MKFIEKLLVEAVGSLLDGNAELGLSDHNSDETSHFSQFTHESINDMLRLKCLESPYSNAITAAFRQVHDYKFISDTQFNNSFGKQMSGMAIPIEERTKAYAYVSAIIKELKEIGLEHIFTSNNRGSEFNSGWNPAMDEIADLTRNADSRDSKASKPFTGGGPAPEPLTESAECISCGARYFGEDIKCSDCKIII